MKRFIEEADRGQLTLLSESLDDYIDESNPVRAIDAFVVHIDLAKLGFEIAPAGTGRPGDHPSSSGERRLVAACPMIESSVLVMDVCERGSAHNVGCGHKWR